MHSRTYRLACSHSLRPRIRLPRTMVAIAAVCAIGASSASAQTIIGAAPATPAMVSGGTVSVSALQITTRALLTFAPSGVTRSLFDTTTLAREALAPTLAPMSTQEPPSRKRRTLLGAAIGAVIGAGATAYVLHTGDSTARCNRNANQDAMTSRQCAGVIGLGAAAGAVVGGGFSALTARR